MLASTLALALACAAPLAAPVTVALSLQPAVGLADEEVASAQQKIMDELGALGVTVVAGPTVDATCMADSACVEGIRGAAEAPPVGLLVLELIRIGPVVQMSATAAAGDRQVVSSESLDEQRLGEGRYLSEAVRAWVQSLTIVSNDTTTSTSDGPAGAPALGGARIGAMVAGGVSALAVVTGATLLVLSDQTLTDPKSSGQDKEGAATLGWAGVASAGVGAVGASVALGLFLLE